MSSLKMYNYVSPSIRKYQGLNRFVYGILFYLGGTMAVFNKKVLRQDYTITLDGEDFSGVYGTINIANGPCYGGDQNPVISAMPNDGLFDAIFFKCDSCFKAAALIPRYVKGEYRKYPNHFIMKRFKKIEIHSENPLLVDLDGEVFFDTSLVVEIVPHAINFAAPDGISYQKRADLNE
jgi:diacylglycerol kinase family enzyme